MLFLTILRICLIPISQNENAIINSERISIAALPIKTSNKFQIKVPSSSKMVRNLGLSSINNSYS